MSWPQRVSSWLIIGILSCLLVLSTASPRLWDKAPQHAPPPDYSQAIPLSDSWQDSETRAPSSSDGSAAWQKGEVILLRPVGRLSRDVPEVSAPPIHADEPLAASQPEVPPTADDEKASLHEEEASEDTLAPTLAGPEPVAPAGKIGAAVTDAPGAAEPVQRLPMVVANVPSRVHAVPTEDLRLPVDASYPNTDQQPSESQTPPHSHADRPADDSWQAPETLLLSLRELAAAEATASWATEVIRAIDALASAMTNGYEKTRDSILDQLTTLEEQAFQLAATTANRSLSRQLKKTGYALARRIDVWREVARFGGSRKIEPAAPKPDSSRLALCLAKIDLLTADSPEGRAWRNYLSIDAMKRSAKRQPAFDQRAMQKTAQEVLDRLAQTPLTPRQQTFVATGPVAAYRAELRHLAVEPVGAADVLRDIERYERSCLPSDAHRLARDCRYLALAPADQRRQLAERVDMHYRNANVRLAVTEELINKLIPEQNLEYAQVNDRVQGYPVRGESLMATELSVRLSPDPSRVRLVLEVKGEISATTTADAGPAQFHNDSETHYVARKPLEIDMQGISVWPSEVGVENNTELRDVNTTFDGIPLIGSLARGVARSQSEQNKPAATRELKQKVASRARQRVDDEARQRLGEFVERMNRRVFDPLNSLALDPQLIDAETTDKRFKMRLRLAGEDQLGSHTPRPQAPADSLASLQIHESVLNNGIQRLQLDGRTFSLAELSRHVAERLSRPESWEINPEHADVKITFAEKDAVIVQCQEGQIILTLSIAELSKATRRWKNFKIRAFYRPEVHGRSAQLAREDVIHLIGERLNLGSQIVLRGIFSRALSKNNSWDLVPTKIANEPKLADVTITQFVIDDGWIGVALGPKRPMSTARKPRAGLR